MEGYCNTPYLDSSKMFVRINFHCISLQKVVSTQKIIIQSQAGFPVVLKLKDGGI